MIAGILTNNDLKAKKKQEKNEIYNKNKLTTILTCKLKKTAEYRGIHKFYSILKWISTKAFALIMKKYFPIEVLQ